jgi:hypothetical protein
MPLLKNSQHWPNSQQEWDQWARNVPVSPDPNSVGTAEIKDSQVTYAKIQTVAAASVIGNSQATSQTPGAITAAVDDRFLARRAGILKFDAIVDTDIPVTVARGSDVSTSITAAIAALQALPDPFPVYQTQTEGDARYVQLANVLNASGTYDPPSLADGVGVTTTLGCSGAALGDFALASFSLDLQGITVSAYVSAANTVAVRFQNESTATVDLASGTLRVRVWKQ